LRRYGGGQSELKLAAENLAEEWSAKGVRIRYISDSYTMEKLQSDQYLKDHHIAIDEHAGTDDTSEMMFLDSAHKWVRTDKLAVSDSAMEPKTGVVGDPTKAKVSGQWRRWAEKYQWLARVFAYDRYLDEVRVRVAADFRRHTLRHLIIESRWRLLPVTSLHCR
jgi:hypothetical protein